MNETLGVIIERIDNLREQNDKDHAAMRAFVQDGFGRITDRQDFQNGRIGKLELWRSALVGGVAVILAGVPAVAWLINFYFTFKK